MTLPSAALAELMAFFSLPRPNGSPGEQRTLQNIQDWLSVRSIPYRLDPFTQYPYFFEAIGVWIVFSRLLLVLSVWLGWGWISLPIALIGLLGGTLDVILGIPLVTWPGRRTGKSVILEFAPPEFVQELLIAAHYDSKTELLDHARRTLLVKNLRPAMLVTLILGGLGPVDGMLSQAGSPWLAWTRGLGFGLGIPLLLLAVALGSNLALGRFTSPSLGAVDNGAACAMLLALSEKLAGGQLPLARTKLLLALFSGEEANMQGSVAFARRHPWSVPSMVVNLEVMGQDGGYVYWEQDGNAFALTPTSDAVNQHIFSAVQSVTGNPPSPAGPVNSDGFSFLRRHIPTGVLGTQDARLKNTGFHRPTDNLDRVSMPHLLEGVEILAALIQQYDTSPPVA